MLKKLKDVLEKNKIWLIVILVINLLFLLLLWLVDDLWIVNDKVFKFIFPTIILGCLILYCTLGFILYKVELKKKAAIIEFINDPSEENEENIIRLFAKMDREVIEYIGNTLRENETIIKDRKRAMDEYQEYIEAWGHEIKTPLGLMTFVLGNRRDEMPDIVYKRLEYSRRKMEEDIERMLYYARLKSYRNDYFFRTISLKELCNNVIEENEVILSEQGIKVNLSALDTEVVTDQKGMEFIINQMISNSIKYKNIENEEPEINIFSEETENSIKLTIRDNGIGVKSYDMPFIFEKGFTGEIGEQRKNSTGMGLYIANEMAKELKVELEPNENYKEGFEISITFPKVKKS